MKRLLYPLIFLLFTCGVASAGPVSCAVNLPLGIPTVKNNVKTICKTAYITAYDYSANWMCY